MDVRAKLFDRHIFYTGIQKIRVQKRIEFIQRKSYDKFSSFLNIMYCKIILQTNIISATAAIMSKTIKRICLIVCVEHTIDTRNDQAITMIVKQKAPPLAAGEPALLQRKSPYDSVKHYTPQQRLLLSSRTDIAVWLSLTVLFHIHFQKTKTFRVFGKFIRSQDYI